MNPDSPDGTADRFEEAWQAGVPPRLELFLPASAERSARRETLLVLVPIDLEYRWRRSAACAWVLEDYVRHFPELGRLEELSPELIAEEYRVRFCWGDAPAIDIYRRRFPTQAASLAESLREMTRALAGEEVRKKVNEGRDLRTTAAAPPVPAAAADGCTQVLSAPHRSPPQGETGDVPCVIPVLPGTPPLPNSVATFVETLRQRGLLTPSQIRDLRGGSPRRFLDVHGLVHELLIRDWLTAYQVNQLLQGQGDHLTLGPYLLLERLGAGGAGQVFKARHRKMDRLVAVKVLHDELATDGECVARFLREIQIVSQLDHPNLIPAYDAGPFGNSYFLAMKYIEGTDLGRLVKKGGPLLVSQGCEYVRQAALGLQHLHRHGLVHRDIKPHNLMIGRDGVIKVADLGLARGAGGQTTEFTRARSVGVTPAGAGPMGTTDYLAPEQAIDFHAADIRADIYSLGCTLWYLLLGQPPFPGRSLAETLLSHQTREVPAIEKLRRDVPGGLAAVLRRMLAKRPEDRYQTPDEVAEAVAPYSRTVPAPEPEIEIGIWSVRSKAYTTWQMLRSFAQRNKTFTASVVTGAATALVFLTWTSVVSYRAYQRTEKAFKETQEAHGNTQKAYGQLEQLTRQAVPALVDQADTLANRREMRQALAQVDLALELDPQHAPARLLKALLLMAQLQFQEAEAELGLYMKQRPDDFVARKLLDRCRSARLQDGHELWQTYLVMREQKPFLGPANFLAMTEISKREEAIRILLPEWKKGIEKGWPGRGLRDRLVQEPGGGLRLDFAKCAEVADLTPLLPIPVSRLGLAYTNVKDLSPLKGKRLIWLQLNGCEVSDLAPLRGMPLTMLNLASCSRVKDLSPLDDMPLNELYLMNCSQIEDLSALQRSRLKILNLWGCRLVRDLSPLKGLPLEELVLYGCQGVNSLSPLQGTTTLRVLDLRGCGSLDLLPLAEVNLTHIDLPPARTTNLRVLQRMETLQHINGTTKKEFWEAHKLGKLPRYEL
jgi:serine/threonine protein kinase